jgi:hypothetical protein
MSEGFWWAALAIAAASAVAHIATMLGTRWGDRAVSFKALLFSLLTHAALFCAIFAVGPRLDRLGTFEGEEEKEERNEPIRIQEIRPNPGESSLTSEPQDAPIWDRPAERPETLPQTLSERPSEIPQNIETVRSVEPSPPPDRAIPAPVELPDAPTASPDVVRATAPEMTPAAAEPPKIEEETAEARTADRPPLARTDRTPAAEAGEGTPVERSALPTATDRMAPDFDPDRQLAGLEKPETPADLPAAEVESDPLKIERSAAPLPAAPDEVAGTGGEGLGTEGDAVTSSRFSRRPTRAQEFGGELPEEGRGNSEKASGPTALPGRDLASLGSDRLRPSAADMPQLSRPDVAPLGKRADMMPEAYQLRQLDHRSEVARRNGGTAASEQAVEDALAWLAANQTRAGSWDADAHGAGQVARDQEGIDRKYAGKTADSGVTALALLAFLGAGYTRDEGKYSENVDRAIEWLVAHQRADGFLGGDAAHFEQNYCHGMATYALAEAHGMRSEPADERLRRPLEKAVAYVVSQQLDDGGWRYDKARNTDGDMSMFGWQLMALRSADIVGVPVPPVAKAKAILFLKDRSLGESGGLAAYRKTKPQTPPTPAMTAEALFCKQTLGLGRENPASVEGVAFLLRNLPKRSETNLYYWYYGTLAMYQYGGSAWDRWNAALRDLLVAEQVKEGPDAGSWEPRDAWGPYGGRVYSTAVAALSLEVYYRFLPLYRAVEQPGGGRSAPNRPAALPGRSAP